MSSKKKTAFSSFRSASNAVRDVFLTIDAAFISSSDRPIENLMEIYADLVVGGFLSEREIFDIFKVAELEAGGISERRSKFVKMFFDLMVHRYHSDLEALPKISKNMFESFIRRVGDAIFIILSYGWVFSEVYYASENIKKSRHASSRVGVINIFSKSMLKNEGHNFHRIMDRSGVVINKDTTIDNIIKIFDEDIAIVRHLKSKILAARRRFNNLDKTSPAGSIPIRRVRSLKNIIGRTFCGMSVEEFSVDMTSRITSLRDDGSYVERDFSASENSSLDGEVSDQDEDGEALVIILDEQMTGDDGEIR